MKKETVVKKDETKVEQIKKEECLTETNSCCKSNPELKSFVGLAASLMGIFTAVVFGVLIFAPNFGGELVPIAWAFAILGMVCAFFMYHTAKKN